VVKRALDIAVTSCAVLVLLPLMLMLAVAVFLDSGWPILLSMPRVGQGGRVIEMLKFRTMVRDPERRRANQPISFPDRRRSHKTRSDPRVTRVGRLLRRGSLDELPQLLNILRGDMSLVGPRPELPGLAAEYETWQWQRFSVPSGLTCYWQVRGRSQRPVWLKCHDDLEYIRDYSLLLDIKLLLKTIEPVIRGRGAY
jgi:lipopolysaccharide/colanic/teichoic acid biosynthesis glycosyltransferase